MSIVCFSKKNNKINNGRENTRARVQRNSVLVENTNGFYPPVRQSIHAVIYEHGLQKRPSRNIFVFQQAEFLCVGLKENRHPTGCLKVNSRKRSFFVQTINDATCSNSIIHYLHKETRRVKRERVTQ
jgi:hypothetical protein